MPDVRGRVPRRARVARRTGIVRLLGVDSEPVNQGWLCDKGRYGYEWVHSRRAACGAPMVAHGRRAGRGVVAGGARRRGRRARAARSTPTGPTSIAVLGGARGTNEDAYVWARFAKGVLGTDNVDAQLGDGLPAEVVLGLPRATIADLDRAAAIVVLGARPQGGAPGAATSACAAPPSSSASRSSRSRRARPGSRRYATAVLRHAPGEPATSRRSSRGAAPATAPRRGDGQIEQPPIARARRPRRRRRRRARPAVGRRVADARSCTAAAALAGARTDVRFLSALRPRQRARRARPRAHARLPARPRHARRGPRHARGAWGACPTRPASTPPASSRGRGRRHDRRARAARRRPARATSPTARSPRAALDAVELVDRASARSPPTAASTPTSFLPVTVWGERTAATTNLEGRVQRLARMVTPEGTTMDDWRIAAELAVRFGADFDLETVDEVQDEIARVAPAFAGVDAALLRRARDGAVLPLADHPDEIVFGPVAARRRRVVGADPRRADDDRGATAARPPTADAEPGREPCRLATPQVAEPPVPLHAWTRRRAGPGRRAARRVQSPPRGRPHALRRRSRSCRRVAVARAARAARARARRAPARPRPHRRRADGDDVRVTSARGHASSCRSRADAADAARHRVPRVRTSAAPVPRRPRRRRTTPVTDLRVETTR